MTQPQLELWAGFECTVNRIGDGQLDQLVRSGHDRRFADLDLLAELGVRAVRYPVLWERVVRGGWRWSDERLERLRELGIRPIIGLVHHGSGPLETSLLDRQFPERLARFAGDVAARYPWVDAWTPVNEPLTTARFSCLYGFWYPHRRDAASFAHALLNQLRAVVLAMRAIRDHVPHAQLVQTDDLGKTHSTPPLRYQAEHENERRWATWDLLSGRRTGIDEWFLMVGIDEAELSWFRDHPCPPDVVGVNHYLSSERFLDHRLERYPEGLHGSNGKDAYVDELAPRVLGVGSDGPARLLREAWDRYRLPLAVTEVHNGSTRDEQLRWLDEVWQAASALRADGADVRAVTLWSLLGAYGWDTLNVGGERYEPGIYDVSSGRPRATALARMAQALPREGRYEHPVLRAPGWWRRRDRFWYPPEGEVAPEPPNESPPLLVLGATGTLGRAVARACQARGLAYRLTSRSEIDAADAKGVATALDRIRPWAIVNATGYVRVDDAEREAERCLRDNRDAAVVLARAAAERALPYVTFSSDLVFDGDKRAPYLEGDAPRPLNVYGRSKAEAEELVLATHDRALVVRTSAFFGPWDEWNFVSGVLADALEGRQIEAAVDQVVSPSYVPDLVDRVLDLLIDDDGGIWHVAGADAVSWFELARMAAAVAGLDARVAAVRTDQPAPRPRYSALGSDRGALLPPLAETLPRYLETRGVEARAA